MAQRRKIKVSEIIEREEVIEKIFLPHYMNDQLESFLPVEKRSISIKLKDDFNRRYVGNFIPGTEPRLGQEIELKYVGEIRRALGMYKLEDERGFCFTYR